jgi:glutathione synthase/RimK-type ligase-like ATP-grasp enzyme
MQINLGVCQKNPSTAAGTIIKILEHLQEYVPQHEDDIFQLICFGDGLSCERHNDAHMGRSNATTSARISQKNVAHAGNFNLKIP